ncbi:MULTISPECIES: EthD family reductase [Streptomyces]|uniref:EthD family reductase n=1 Tax=Streptomyces edwardsiae TaxID=3075527 RepID=A0ABU2PQU2_9ACTN|nr:EthD family reductase [Streptomyces sp. DSM 41636]MDT0393695.1 EthD family reductase [Streptomyces sp. DSM 41636]
METVYVTYRSTGENFRFDHDYFESVHLPLVRKAWGKYGLVSSTAVYPKGEGNIVVVAVNEFRDQQAAIAAFGAPESEEVMSDIVRYTDLTPSRLRGVSFTY